LVPSGSLVILNINDSSASYRMRGFMTAALTPRVRTLIVCDSVKLSTAEEDVFHLRGARWQVHAVSFPFRRRLRLFVLLSNPREGRYPGYIRVIHDESERAVFYGAIEPAPLFERDSDFVPIDLPIRVTFPQAGRYTVQVWFFQESSADVLKMELPFFIWKSEV
jgi:hypothetical protein